MENDERREEEEKKIHFLFILYIQD